MAYNYSYNTLIDRFKAFADGHYLIRKFTHGQIDLADLDLDGEYPYMHVAPGSITPVPGAMQFGFEVLFMDLPRDKEYKAEYQRESLSDCIRLAQDLIVEIAVGHTLFGLESALGTQPTIQPMIEEYKHVLTGVQLSLVLELPYDWSACDIPADYSVGGTGSGGAGVALGITFKVNGTDNVVQNVLDLVQGTGISITDNGDGSVTISNTGGGGGGVVAWGDITGTLSTQTDLQNALDAKADLSSLAAVAISGDYDDLNDLPTIPAAQIQSDWTQSDNTQLDYIKNKPTLPATVGDMLKSVYDVDNDGVVDSAERVEIIVRNSTGSTLTKGQVVYLSGATGNRPNAVLADATDEITSSKTIGIVTANITNNSDGYVAVNGTLHDLDTSAFTAGDTLWLSETAGAMQANTPPSEPAHAVFIGYVARSHPNLGRIVLAIQNGYELNELHGVLVPSPSANDVLYYDGSTSLWKNKALSKYDVGLGNVDNTSDANKPVSSAQQTAINAKVTANAPITGATKTKITYDSKGLVTSGADLSASDLPTGIDAAKIGSGVVSNTEFGYLDGVTSAIQTQLNGTQDKLVSGTNIKTINSTTVLGSGNFDLQDRLVSGTNIKTIEGQSLLGAGNIDLTKSDVGLGNVDNTSDANKPISTATQTALNAKQDTLVSGTNIKTVNSTSLLGSGNVAVAAQDSISLINNTSITLGASTTSFVSFCAFTTNSTEANRQVIIPIAGTVKNLYVLTSTTQSANNSQVCTVRKNGVNTSIVATIAANAAAGTFSDTTNTVSVAAGDRLSLQVANNAASGTAATIVSVAIIIERS